VTTLDVLAPDRTYPRFSDAEFERRFEQLRARMDSADIETLILCGRGGHNPDVLYLTNWLSTREAWVVFPRVGETTMLIQLSNHLPLAKLMANTPDVRFGASGRWLDSWMSMVGQLTWREHARLVAALPEIELVDFGAAMREQRQVKSAEEMERLSRSAEMCDLSAKALAEQARAGLTEWELGKIVEDSYLGEGGINGIHFMVATSMADPQGGVPCQHLSGRKLKNGDVLVVELSTNYWGYSAQILRSYSIGADPTPLYESLHAAAEAVFYGVADVIKPGATVSDIHDAAELANQHGFTIYDDLVHGAAQLPPIVRTRQTYRGEPAGFTYAEGMCLVTTLGWMTRHIQFGEMFRVSATGLDPLHDFRREFIRCP
jgi:Xaa-Pro dipeptidase